MTQAESSRSLCVHACGRLEVVPVQELTLSQVQASARRAFDLPSSLELVLRAPDGKCLDSDCSLEGLASVYAELPDGGVHDLEQRIDQLQHMQISCLCERVTGLCADQLTTQATLRALGDNLVQERGARQHLQETVSMELQSLRDDMFQRLEVVEAKLQIAMEEAAMQRGTAEVESREVWKDVERRLAKEIQDLRQASRLETSDTEQNLARIERGLQEQLRDVARCTASIASETAASVAAASAATVEAARAERQERLTAEDTLSNKLDELCRWLSREVQERIVVAAGAERQERLAAEAALSTKLDELGAALAKEVQERAAAAEAGGTHSVALMELGDQLRTALESFQQERLQRASEEVPASPQAVEALRRACEEIRRRTEDSELAVGRMMHDLARRLQEESEGREAEGSALLLKLMQETEQRLESEGEVSRLLAALEESIGQEGEHRGREAKQTNDKIESCIEAAEQERRIQDELLKRVDRLSQTLVEVSAKVCIEDEVFALQSEVIEHEKQLQTLERVAAKLSETSLVLPQVPAIQRSLEDQGQKIKTFRDELAEMSAIVLEERAGRGDDLRKLREDCREAMQREIGARLQEASRLRDDLEAEGRARKETLGILQRAISECETS